MSKGLVTCTRKLEFDAGHRVLGHGGKCQHLHGHRYVAEVTARAQQLNELSMVVDFSIIKTAVGAWIDHCWDHNMILNPADPLCDAVTVGDEGAIPLFEGRQPYIMPKGVNPTAESLAQVLFDVAGELLNDINSSISVVHVRMYETPNCWADYPVHSLDDHRARSSKTCCSKGGE